MDIIQMAYHVLSTEFCANNPLLFNFSTGSPVFQQHSTIFLRRRQMKKILFLSLLISLLMAGVVCAQTPASSPSKVDSGDTTWLLISAALVMLMTPGLALFYGGMVRSKNVLGTIMQSFIALGIITI
jgi:hypothetical protein